MTSPPDRPCAPRPIGRLLSHGGRPLGLLLLLALLGLRVVDPEPVERARLLGFDLYQRLLPRPHGQRLSGLGATADYDWPVCVVAIDDASLAEFGQWPWPRDQVARLVDAIVALEPHAIGIDVLFPEPDRLSPERVVERYPQLDDASRTSIAALGSTDELLGQSIRRAQEAGVPVVVAVAAEAGNGAGAWVADSAVGGQISLDADGGATRVPSFAGVVRSVDPIHRAAVGYGDIARTTDVDGVHRRLPTVVRVGSDLVPSLFVEMLRVGADSPFAVVSGDAGGAVTAVEVAEYRLPTEPDGSVWIHFLASPPGDRMVSAVDLLGGSRLAASRVQKRIVLIGLTATGVDLAATPVDAAMLGIEIHAQAIEQAMLAETMLRRPRSALAIELALCALSGLAIVLLVPVLRSRWTVGALVLIVPALILAALVAFRTGGLLIDVSYPTFTCATLVPAMLGCRLLAAERARRRLEVSLREQTARAQRLEGELAAARDIQMGMLPRRFPAFPDRTEFDVHAFVEPARAVGGDLYDFFLLSEDRLFFLIGDVSGKGVRASLFMALTKALTKSSTMRRRVGLGEIITETNQELGRDNNEMLFVTVFAGILDVATGELEYCNAGHDHPLVLGPGAPLLRLTSGGGPPLCAVDDFVYETGTARVEAGESLVLFTDGVTEAMNAAHELYGLGRVEALLVAAGPDSSPKQIVERLTADVARFVAGAEPSDDLTLLVVKRVGPAPSR